MCRAVCEKWEAVGKQAVSGIVTLRESCVISKIHMKVWLAPGAMLQRKYHCTGAQCGKEKWCDDVSILIAECAIGLLIA